MPPSQIFIFAYDLTRNVWHFRYHLMKRTLKWFILNSRWINLAKRTSVVCGQMIQLCWTANTSAAILNARSLSPIFEVCLRFDSLHDCLHDSHILSLPQVSQKIFLFKSIISEFVRVISSVFLQTIIWQQISFLNENMWKENFLALAFFWYNIY